MTKLATTVKHSLRFLYFAISMPQRKWQIILIVGGIEQSILKMSEKNMKTKFFSCVISDPTIVLLLLLSFLLRISDHWLFICYSSFIYSWSLLQEKVGALRLSLIPKKCIKSLLTQFLFFVLNDVVVLIFESFFLRASL